MVAVAVGGYSLGGRGLRGWPSCPAWLMVASGSDK